MNAQQQLEADRKYWGIENGSHQRLVVIAGADRSRVRHRNAALNLAVIRPGGGERGRALDQTLQKPTACDHEWFSRFHGRRKSETSAQTLNPLQTLMGTQLMIQSYVGLVLCLQPVPIHDYAEGVLMNLPFDLKKQERFVGKQEEYFSGHANFQPCSPKLCQCNCRI